MLGERRSSFSKAWKIGTLAEGKPRRDAVVDKLLQLRTFRNFGKGERDRAAAAAVKTFKHLNFSSARHGLQMVLAAI